MRSLRRGFYVLLLVFVLICFRKELARIAVEYLPIPRSSLAIRVAKQSFEDYPLNSLFFDKDNCLIYTYLVGDSKQLAGYIFNVSNEATIMSCNNLSKKSLSFYRLNKGLPADTYPWQVNSRYASNDELLTSQVKNIIIKRRVSDHYARVYRIVNGKSELISGNLPAGPCCFSSTGRFVAIARSSGLEIWDIRGKLVDRFVDIGQYVWMSGQDIFACTDSKNELVIRRFYR